MAMQGHQILPLPQEVQSQIKSSITITSLSDVVIELIKNSLDAQARTVYIDIDYLRGGCCVEDDGNGIPAVELSEYGHLGSMYCTSKHNSLTETYGIHGRFVSYLSALSLLSITSRHRADADECTVVFHESRVIARFQTIQEHQRVLHKKHGTKVTVWDLFRKLPVRVKHRAIQYEFQGNLDKEFEELKRKIVSLMLAWSRPTKIVLSDMEKRRSLLRLDWESSSSGEGDSEIDVKLPFRLNWVCALLFQARYIVQPPFVSWATASAQTSTISIRAAISLEPAPTKQVQFVSFGIRPVDSVRGTQVLFDEVNRIFALSSFGAIEDNIEISGDEKSRGQFDKRHKSGNYKTRPLRCTTKGVDRWPMFYIRIDSSSECRTSDDGQASDPGGEAVQILGKVMQLLKIMIYQFLEEHLFRSRVRRQKQRNENHMTVHMQNPFGDLVTYLPVNEVSSQSADTTTSTAGPTPQSNESRLQRHVTSPGFDSWSRVKSTKRDGLDHNLYGLPRSRSLEDGTRPATALAVSNHGNNSIVDIGQIALADAKPQHSLEHDVQNLLQDMQNEEVQNDARLSMTSASDAPTVVVEDALRLNNNIPEDETILWTNPTTRRVVHINSRTGLIIPNTQMQNASDEANNEALSNEPFGEAALVSRADLARLIRPTGKTMKSGLHVAPEPWIGKLLKSSETVIFRQLEATIPSVTPEEVFRYGEDSSCCHGRPGTGSLNQMSAFNAMTAATRLSKGDLDDAQVLAQVDRKFILVRITTSQTHAQTESPNGKQQPEQTALVLIDQHAADERCQVEALYAELCNMEVVQLLKPMYFNVSDNEIRLFDHQKDFFADWGFRYEIYNGDRQSGPQFASARTPIRTTTSQPKDNLRITVTTLPYLIADRCRLDPKSLIDLLRREIWARVENRCAKSRSGVSSEESESTQPALEACRGDTSWLTKISTCPKGLIEMLNSRACKSAIMFNDKLSKAECQALVKRLAECSFPFQCAHGRPSMVVLGGLKVVNADEGWPLGPDTPQDHVGRGVDFTRAFDKWQANVRKGSAEN